MSHSIDDLRKIDLLQDFTKRKLAPAPSRLSRIGKILFKFCLIILFIITFFFSNVLFSGNSLLTSFDGGLPQIGFVGLIQQIKAVISPSSKNLTGQDADRINILLLGMGGVQHEGPYLTDTIILASIKPSTNQIALISIPRDLYAPIPGYGWRRINNANAFGEEQNPGQGAELAVETVSQVLDLPIHYYARINFSGFETLIDDLDGLTIDVDQGFVDTQYPAANYEYQTVSFKAGEQKMNGDQVLKFVRSRHGTNGEASDFSRAKRQQKVLFSIKEKVFPVSTLFQPQKLIKIYNNVSKNLKTDLSISQINSLINIVKNVKQENIITQVFDDSPDGYLRATITPDGAYVLIPNTGNFKDISSLINNIFNNSKKLEQPASQTTAEPLADKNETPQKSEEKPKEQIGGKIIILNGSGKTGLAGQAANQLAPLGYTITKIGNADRWDYDKSVIYDLTQNKKTENIKLLKEKFNANTTQTLPQYLNDLWDNSLDFIIVLGSNYSQK